MSERPSVARAQTDVLRAAREARSTDEFFARVHESVPGFAGLLLEDGVPTAYLTDLEGAALAEAVLTPFLVDRGNGGRGFQVRQARYSWAELYPWRMEARALFGLEELRSLGISVPRNRIVVGAAPGTATENTLERLVELGIDPEAVDFEEAEEVPRMAQLDDRHRPVMGGLQISRSDISWACSHGANVLWDDTLRTFLTAGHCLLGTSANPIYQPLSGSSQHIGTELLRSPYHTCSPNDPGAPSSTNRCLNSDAALIAYDDTVDWSFGHIARTHSAGTWQGSKTVVGRFWITDSYYLLPLDGDTIHKIGWKTGWTTGETTENTCKDYYSDGDWLICQTEVEAGAGSGDSGSPTFRRSGYGTVTLAGILWGAWPDSVFMYSSMFDVEEDLGGYLDVITSAPTPPSGVSISGPTVIEPDAICEWQGNVTGGTTPFTYEWRNDGIVVSDTDTYQGGKLDGTLGSSFVLRFTVKNDAGVEWDEITVTEDPNAFPCLM